MEITMVDPESRATFLASPIRDVAYFLPQILKDTGDRLDPSRIPPEDKAEIEAPGGCGWDEIQRGYAALNRFMATANDPDLDMLSGAHAVGLMDLDPMAGRIVLANFARSVTGAIWGGLRSSLMAGDTPALLSVFKKRGEQLALEFAKGRQPAVSN